MTGVGCPGCGLTRSICAFSRGQVGASLSLHIFGPIFYMSAFVGWVYLLICIAKGKDPFDLTFNKVSCYLIGTVIGLMLYWTARLIFGGIP
jgi:hypothetical protein